jgi:hypothetical protein
MPVIPATWEVRLGGLQLEAIWSRNFTRLCLHQWLEVVTQACHPSYVERDKQEGQGPGPPGHKKWVFIKKNEKRVGGVTHVVNTCWASIDSEFKTQYHPEKNPVYGCQLHLGNRHVTKAPLSSCLFCSTWLVKIRSIELDAICSLILPFPVQRPWGSLLHKESHGRKSPFSWRETPAIQIALGVVWVEKEGHPSW